MTVSSTLNWKSHVNEVIKKANQWLGILRQLASKLPRSYLAPIVHWLAISVIRYGMAIYGQPRLADQESTNSTTPKLQVVINNYARFLTNSKLSDRVTVQKLLEYTNLPSVNQLTTEQILCEAHIALKTDIPEGIWLVDNDFRKRTQNAYPWQWPQKVTDAECQSL